jgi:hypothetical protein
MDFLKKEKSRKEYEIHLLKLFFGALLPIKNTFYTLGNTG